MSRDAISSLCLFETTPLALIGLSAIGFGVYLLARRDWVAGVFVILIGVTGGLPALEPLLARRERSASRIDLVAVDGNYRQGLVFPLSRGKQWVRLPMFIALAALYVFIAVAVANPVALVWGSLGFAVALVLIWFVARDLRGPEKRLALLPEGVVAPTLERSPSRPVGCDRAHRGRPWPARRDVRSRLEEARLVATPTLLAPHGRVGRGPVPVDDLVASEDEFRETLERCLADPEARRAIGHELERAETAAG